MAMEDIDLDLPKFIVIECDFFLPGYDLLFILQ